MAQRLIREKNCEIIVLKIDSRIIDDNSYISNRNATAKNAKIILAREIKNYKEFLDFDAINEDGEIEYGTERYALHQAEALIKTKVPLEYIKGTFNY